jgi:hypothetical protein
LLGYFKHTSIALADTSCILAWLIEQGYEVYAFMADVGQEEVGSAVPSLNGNPIDRCRTLLPLRRKPSKSVPKSSSWR